MAHATLTAKGFTWHHFSRATEEDLQYLQENFKFHHLDYEDIRMETQIAKMDPYKHYIFFVFQIPSREEKSGHVHGEDLHIFLSEDSLVTITNRPIPSVENFMQRLQKSSKSRTSMFSGGTAYIMYKLLLQTFRDSLPILTDLTNRVTELENQIQHARAKDTTVALGRVRRNVLFLRHIIDPQRHLLTSLTSMKRAFISEDSALYFDDLHDVLDTIWLTSDNLKLIIDGLFDVNEALLSHQTNRVVTTLTILSACLMVPTFISGFYGMNVPWLPFREDAMAISLLYISGLFVIVAIILIVSRRDRM